MNISTKNDITVQKIIAICSLKTDIIFLSDMRLNTSKQISALHDLEKTFLFNGYKLVHNSSLSNRGVGILFKKDFNDTNLSVIRSIKDTDCNSLILHVRINNHELVLASIYGPNHDNELEFFNVLQTNLQNFQCPVIVGGDWNATLDNSEVGVNIDVVNMRNIPSVRRTNRIIEFCRFLSLVDPYRFLYPSNKEYTFIPSSRLEHNRSRLDFFLISECFLNNPIQCIIPHSLTTTLFDHKPVRILIEGKKKSRKGIVKDCILEAPDLTHHVRSAVFECYLQHWSPGNNRDGTVTLADEVGVLLGSIGRINTLLVDIQNMDLQTALDGVGNELNDLLIAGKRAEVQLIFEEMPDLNFFENLNLGCTPDVFFQTLVNCIKNNTLSHQAYIFRLRETRKKLFKNRIIELKQNFLANSALILQTERELSDIIESELKLELLHYKKFESLNNEKITPYFMNLVKSKNTRDSLDNVRKDDGTTFSDKNELKNYIGIYYSNIYKQADNQAKNVQFNDIENFLGDIRHNPIVANSILNNDEKTELESDITLEELTKSVNNANLSSAPGGDGISNRFIKKFWEYFKVPLLNLCNYCHDNGSLPLFFRTANIKLIPKKGNLAQLKNWRPISLLNCFYKIISRLITFRLRKYMDKMTPVCQKGYSGTRYCQEVLISLIEKIEKCNKLRKRACLLSLDVKKAFDSLSHSYLQNVYRFYNFGPKLVKWLTLLGTNRKACVIIDCDFNTDLFDLERGNAQGDTISPFLFNLGYQLLLYKLEFSLQIAGILNEDAVSADNFVSAQGHPHQVINGTPKAFALADDCTLLVELDSNNLQTIIEILRDFENLSGLECNVEKTALMAIGPTFPVPDDIINLGFEIKNEITLLGCSLKNHGLCYDSNAQIIIDKMRNKANFWKRFNLSLPGRITVAKTFLYSQINYLGCILPFTPNEIRNMSDVIENFVAGKLSIAKTRFYQSRAEGGLELMDLNEYLSSQVCSWVRRAYSMDELWKKELLKFSTGSLFNLRAKNYDKGCHPILHHIALCFEKFIFKFTSVKENYKKIFIFDNPCITFDFNRPHFLQQGFFTGQEWDRYGSIIKNLTMDKLILPDNTIATKENFQLTTGILISDLKFQKLRGLALASVRKFQKIRTEDKKHDTIQNFIMRIKSGSKRIRNILHGPSQIIVSNNIAKYAELTETFIDSAGSSLLNSAWCFTYLSNNFRTFIFKLHNNRLGLNTRVAHFIRGHPDTCTFCDLSREPEENREGLLHLFYNCRHVEILLGQFYGWFFNNELRVPPTRYEYFCGYSFECTKKNKTMLIINLVVKKYIWDCKLRFNLPSFNQLKTYFCSELNLIISRSLLMKKIFEQSHLFEHLPEIQF